MLREAHARALRREAAADTAVRGGEALRFATGCCRGSGVGVEDDHGRSACSRGAAVKPHVEITSHS